MIARKLIHAIDHHHGQANRTVLSGYPSIRGTTMREKEAYYLEHLSWIHECLCREPRGHSAMLGSIVTEPVSDTSVLGVLFLHGSGLYDGCGDSTFGTAAAAVETGMIAAVEPVTRFSMDTVMGPLPVEVDVSDGIVTQVRYQNLPSYHITQFELDLEGWGKVVVDVSQCGGQYCPQIDAGSLGISTDKSNQAGIKAFGRLVNAALLELPPIKDPETGKMVQLGRNNANVISLYAMQDDGRTCRIANTSAPDFMGRTPGGTPTGALLALLHARGDYAEGTNFANISPVGSVFHATGHGTTLPNGTPALTSTIGTKSWLMGIHQFVVDPSDPYPNGFIL